MYFFMEISINMVQISNEHANTLLPIIEPNSGEINL
jgi:hypothetical protein